MHSLQTLWLAFFDICRLRSGPQNLPASPILLKFTLLFYMIISGASSLMHLSVKEAILSTIADTALFVILPSSLLYITHYSIRIIQTLTALVGSNCVLSMLSLPLVFWIKFYDGDVSFPMLLFLGLMVWNFIVYAHILRHALAVPFFVGAILTVIYEVLHLTILNQVVPFIK